MICHMIRYVAKMPKGKRNETDIYIDKATHVNGTGESVLHLPHVINVS